MFREVSLPPHAKGHLYLHSMPGRFEPLSDSVAEAARLGISTVVCLAPLDEIHRKSPDYASDIEAGKLPWQQDFLPISDFGVPEDSEGFRNQAQRTAKQLQQGENCLIHCGAGIGRTGTLAVAVLLALGLPQDQAERAVAAAGSRPETQEQRQLLGDLARRRAED
jgi:protein-tyrosine phosphatase